MILIMKGVMCIDCGNLMIQDIFNLITITILITQQTK